MRQESRWKNSTTDFAAAAAAQNRADCVDKGIGTARKVGEFIAKMSGSILPTNSATEAAAHAR